MPLLAMTPAVASLVGAGVSAAAGVAGGLLNRSKTSTSSTAPVYTPEQQGIQHQLADTLSARLANPGQPFQGAKVGAIDSVNKGTDSLTKRLQSNFSSRGFGESGKLLTDTRAIEQNRIGTIGSLDAKFAGMQADYETGLVNDAERFGFAGAGSTTTSTAPGNVAGGAVGGAGQTLTTLFTLNQLLKGGKTDLGRMN